MTAALKQFERDSSSFSTSELARAANVSRRFIYDHRDLLAEADAIRLRIMTAYAAGSSTSTAVTAASLRADLENTKAQNTRLRSQLAAAEARLGELLGAEAAAEAGWIPPDVKRQLDGYAETHANEQARIRELEQELEQVRRLNRELTTEVNRTPLSSGLGLAGRQSVGSGRESHHGVLDCACARLVLGDDVPCHLRGRELDVREQLFTARFTALAREPGAISAVPQRGQQWSDRGVYADGCAVPRRDDHLVMNLGRVDALLRWEDAADWPGFPET